MSHQDEARPADPADGGTVHLRRPPQEAPPQVAAPQVAAPEDAVPPAARETVRLAKQADVTVDLRSRAALPPGTPDPDQDESTVRMDVNSTVLLPTVVLPAEPTTLRELQPEAEAGPMPVSGVLRFGPGVPDPGTARTIAVWQGAAPGPGTPLPTAPRRRRWTRVLPVLLVLLAIAGYLLWQRVGPPLAVASVSLAATPAALPCGGTEQLTATVRTNGRRGTLHYHWARSDGTDSGPLTQSLPAGAHEVQLPLRWTVQGQGDFHGIATLDVTAPGSATASAGFGYSCH
jgi:hypothetical protein